MLANREDALLHMLGLWNHIFTASVALIEIPSGGTLLNQSSKMQPERRGGPVHFCCECVRLCEF